MRSIAMVSIIILAIPFFLLGFVWSFIYQAFKAGIANYLECNRRLRGDK